jgi:hypothetical protein
VKRGGGGVKEELEAAPDLKQTKKSCLLHESAVLLTEVPVKKVK